MRPRVLVPISIVALIIIGIAWLFRPKAEAPAPTPTPAVEEAVAKPPPPPIYRPPDTNEPIALVHAEPTEAQQEAKRQYVSERVNELNELAMSNDPQSLQQILLELDNSDPDIRSAAVEAAAQFKSPAAIPALQSAEDQATDLNEKIQIKNAIDFLSLAAQQDASNSSQ